MTATDRPSDLDDDDCSQWDDAPYCECNLSHTIEEQDFNTCDCCGRPIE